VNDDPETVDPVAAPSFKGKLTNQQILLGQKRDPLQIITTYSDAEWESFILEWVDGIRNRYKEVRRANADGRSVMGV
jgi:hypothetical protein